MAQTPDMLEVLKRAGVVDSGGFGLITLFKGLIMGYLDQEITGAEECRVAEVTKPQSIDSAFPDDNELVVDYESLGQLDFGYCTEFFITNIKKRTTVTDIDKLREYLKRNRQFRYLHRRLIFGKSSRSYQQSGQSAIKSFNVRRTR